MILKFLSIFVGGGIGAFIRYLVSIGAKKYLTTPIIGTFFVNIIGCFFIGYIFALTINKGDNFPAILKLFLTVGLLGGLTTFSTFNLEIFELIKSGRIFTGLLYLFISCFVGLFLTYLGYYSYYKF